MAGDIPAEFRRHGGRLRAAAESFSDAPLPWVDLSTGINPHPYEIESPGWQALALLPEPEDVTALEAVAAAAFGLTDARRIASVPGSEIGLRLLPQCLGGDSVAIVGPTYGGHAEAWNAAGRQTAMIAPADIEQAVADIVVIVNPNNPDGRVIPPGALRRVAEIQVRRGGWLVVDEAFADLSPDCSVAPHVGEALIVLRSFGKFYGLAGVRLGFVLADPAVTARLRATLGDWPVSAPAILAGLAAYADRDWATRTRARLARNAARLDLLLAETGIEIVGGTHLFRLGRCANAGRLFTALARRGVLVRPFKDEPDRIRFGLPRDESDWSRLEAALKDGKE